MERLEGACGNKLMFVLYVNTPPPIWESSNQFKIIDKGY